MEETVQPESNGFTPIKLPPATGPRPHRCEVCQRCFREVATLRKHEQLHRADRPYVCTTCGKSFLWSSNLKVHERVHTGERPYKCKICHRCFTQSNDLRRHERNVHMRGKLCGYKTQGRNTTSQVNLATYQAFAMQQRAMLQQALTYESMRMQQQTVASTQGHILHHHSPHEPPPRGLPLPITKEHSLLSTSNNPLHKADSPIKLEQVTPPSTPIIDRGERHHEKRCLSTSSESLQSPHSSNYTQGRMIHSAPILMSSGAYGVSKAGYSQDALMMRRPSYSPPESSTNQTAGLGLPAPHRREYIPTPYCQEPDKSPEDTLPDTVMDLSMAKTPSVTESEEERHMPYQTTAGRSPKTPGDDSECEGKRDVTTTSVSPSADSGIHQCQHCNIFFYDYTMFNLHKSLHSPYEENPFRCPSCSKHCQDRIEFMFHTVWHVKYPHTIPNYHSFRDEYVA
ncbi:hypothetical protein SNE40_006278 [Patella caerulea]|uniref:C2H2-type domain-containing protein n=1 Tax=Patella caerulea TaxID=87958 RepID=A0AAN8K2A8_PATCE